MQSGMSYSNGDRRPLRVGICGASSAADSHIRALRSIRGADVVAICDMECTKADAIRRHWGLEFSVRSPVELVEKAGVDVVHVTAPPNTHADIATACLEAGAHIFIEQPLAPTVVECRRIMMSAARLGRAAAANHSATFHPAFLDLIDHVRARRFGALHHVIACMSVPLPDTNQGSCWMLQQPENVLLELAPRPLSQIRRLLGDIQTVSAVRSGKQVLKFGTAFYDTWQLSMSFTRGTAQCFLTVGKSYDDHWLWATGEDGAAFVDMRRNFVRVSDKSRFTEPVDQLIDAARNARCTTVAALGNIVRYLVGLGGRRCRDAHLASIQASVCDFYGALTSGKPLSATLQEGYDIVTACELALRSTVDERLTTVRELSQYAM